ncbi:MAG: hypothetical protein ACKVS9_05040 [Phycisphaerae bacterium]
MLIATCAASMSPVGVSTVTADDFQAHCQYLGEAPSGETTWSNTVAGIANDSTHWYLAQHRNLWRVPAHINLGSVSASTPGVTMRTTFPELSMGASDTWTFGDPCVYRHNGIDYLVVRVNVFDSSPFDTIAVFDAQSLFGISRRLIADRVGSAVGVDPMGFIYLNRVDSVGNLDKWQVDWDALQQTGTLQFTFVQNVTLREANDAPIPSLPGGIRALEFTPDGRYLYVLADDIHVFDGDTLRRRFQSNNATTGFFPFNWDTTPSVPPEETPAGLCIWNLNGTGSPHNGQLHVAVRDWDGIADSDDVFLKHYTYQINVNASAAPGGNGSIATPYRTITQAAAAAWYGAELRIRANLYDEAVRIDRHVRLTTFAGVTRIGG